MKVVAVLLSLGLSACASVRTLPPAGDLLHDSLFHMPSARIDPADAMAVSAEMRQYLAARIPIVARRTDRKRMLIDALYRKDDLKLEYDAATTRTASQAFRAREGNCLALVLMTAALAKELGLAVRYQQIVGVDELEHFGDLYLSVGHVNVTLDDRPAPAGVIGIQVDDSLTVDFLPPRKGQFFRSRPIAERRVIAMFLNNRAVEALTAGDVAGAYWWARQSVLEDPQFAGAYLTLAVVYRKHGHPELADPVLARLIESDPGNVKAITNRLVVLRDLGRSDEVAVLQRRLDDLDPHPPFTYFREGLTAMQQRRFETARDLFAREAARAPHNHEVQFWLAVVNVELHDTDRARAHLKLALEFSTTRRDHDLYAGKLARLNSLPVQ